MSGLFREKEQKARVVKTGLDAKDSRSKRQEKTSKDRKEARDQMLQRVRRGPPGSAAEAAKADAGSAAAAVVTMSPAELAEKVAQLPAVAQLLLSAAPTLEQLREALLFVRALITLEKVAPLQQVVDAGVVPGLMAVLRVPDEELQVESLWSLTNIAAGDSCLTAAVVQAGGIQNIIALLSSESSAVREQAVWTLGNIAGDSPAYRDTILSYGALDTLLALAHAKGSVAMLRNITWTISNLCRGYPLPDWAVVSRTLPTLACMLSCDDDEIIADAAWSLTALADAEGTDPNVIDQHLAEIIEAGVVQRLVLLLSHPNIQVRTPALRVVGNISSGDADATDALLNNNVLTPLRSLLGASRRQLRKEACWTLSNITAGVEDQVLAVANADVFPRVVELMSAKEAEIRREATWCITNAIAADIPDVTRYLVHRLEVLPSMALMLNYAGTDPKLIVSLLESVDTALRAGHEDAENELLSRETATNEVLDKAEECELVDIVLKLRDHDNSKVAALADEISLRYFCDEDAAQQMGDAPQVTAEGTFAFGADPSAGAGAAFGGADPSAGGAPFSF